MPTGVSRATMRVILILIALATPFASADAGFSFNGLISHGAAACAPAAGCAAAQLPQDQVFTLGRHEGERVVHATLRWVRATPLADELRLGVSYDDAAGDRVHTFVQGASPLTLDVSVPVHGELLVWANFPETVEGVPVWVSAQQAFQIDGVVG